MLFTEALSNQKKQQTNKKIVLDSIVICHAINGRLLYISMESFFVLTGKQQKKIKTHRNLIHFPRYVSGDMRMLLKMHNDCYNQHPFCLIKVTCISEALIKDHKHHPAYSHDLHLSDLSTFTRR